MAQMVISILIHQQNSFEKCLAILLSEGDVLQLRIKMRRLDSETVLDQNKGYGTADNAGIFVFPT